MKENKDLNLGLCKNDNYKISGIKGYIFESSHIKNIKNPKNDSVVILNYIYLTIMDICSINQDNYIIYDEFEQTLKIDVNIHINLYFEESNMNTIALIYILNSCKLYGLSITLYHYDKETGEYFPQEVM